MFFFSHKNLKFDELRTKKKNRQGNPMVQLANLGGIMS